MAEDVLTTRQAPRLLGISAATLYDWLAQSNAGRFTLHGQPVTIDYRQTGARGQGRIQIEVQEVERLKDLMRVRPRSPVVRRSPITRQSFPGITVKLGRPNA